MLLFWIEQEVRVLCAFLCTILTITSVAAFDKHGNYNRSTGWSHCMQTWIIWMSSQFKVLWKSHVDVSICRLDPKFTESKRIFYFYFFGLIGRYLYSQCTGLNWLISSAGERAHAQTVVPVRHLWQLPLQNRTVEHHSHLNHGVCRSKEQSSGLNKRKSVVI